MVAILLILFIILLFSALPTWPYSASGRARYRVASVGERTARAAAKLPQFSRGEALHTMADDYTSQLRELQNELQNALDQVAKSSPQKPKLREADRSKNSREQWAA
jgi:type II secretory pathway pseudopilin PulG